MGTSDRVELTAATALFIGISGGVGIARGHPPGVLILLLLAPLLAALVTLVARYLAR